MQAAAHRIGLHPNPDQIVALKAVQSVFPADAHTSILRSLSEKNLCGGRYGFTGGFAISTMFLEVKRGEVVVKRVVKRGG
jgi:hypothetical protein